MRKVPIPEIEDEDEDENEDEDESKLGTRWNASLSVESWTGDQIRPRSMTYASIWLMVRFRVPGPART